LPYANHQGTGQGPALVLQHGLGGSLEVWRQLGYAAALRDNYTLIMLDARGHGASDKPHDRGAYGLPCELVAVKSWTGITARPRVISRFFSARGMVCLEAISPSVGSEIHYIAVRRSRAGALGALLI
jgi:pimeloyl-ACP methyl ester carboxylesterase